MSIDVQIEMPPRQPGERDATAAQALSVAQFYTVLPDNLGFEQAHALLSYRNYARTAVEAILGIDPDAADGKLMARMLAAAISIDAPKAGAALAWSEHNFEHPDHPKAVADTPCYVDAARLLSAWYEELS